MTDSSRFSLARLFTLLGALWLAVGAFYKLFAGNPGDLPKPFFDWFGWMSSKDNLYILAIAVELAVITLAVFRPKFGWIALVGTFLFFEAILAPLIAEGAESCGCLGGTITIPPLVMASIDGVIVIGLLASRPWKASGMRPVAPTAIVGLLLVASVVAPVLKLRVTDDGMTIAEIEQAQQQGKAVELPKHVTLTPPEWIGEFYLDTPLAKWLPDMESLPTDGTWLFWRWTCDHCAAHLAELAENPPLEPLVLIRVRERQDTPENGAVYAMPQGAIEVELTDRIEWVLSTPADMRLEGGMVVEARENIE
ncbi:MAG: hypothetical protein H6831_16285 [Planctomycetes bacterium]|nr:hypothetical protein [Planctomycetota bacterium]MCB9905959.1 hypothetical protein [Planctomycetota bacterium]